MRLLAALLVTCGLRDYGLPPIIWGGDPLCEHEWDTGVRPRRKRYDGDQGKDSMQQANKAGSYNARPTHFCLRCGAWRGCLGLEPVHDCLGWATGNRCGACYVCHMVEIFGEVRRVLRDDGTLWIVIGDSYATGGGPARQALDKLGERLGCGGGKKHSSKDCGRAPISKGLKPKDLCGIPARVVLALQADGWWWRNDIIWHKLNPMPESIRDRCTKSHEYVFMLAKSKRYYFDQDAIREPHKWKHVGAMRKGVDSKNKGSIAFPVYGKGNTTGSFRAFAEGGRNKRSVWQADNILYEFLRFATEQGVDIDALAAAFIEGQSGCKDVWTLPTKPFKSAHFAVFPPALIRPMILAGTSARGACPECSAPWERVVERKAMVIDRSERTHPMGRTRPSGTMLEPAQSTTLGWRPTCTCYDALYRQFPKARKARKRHQRDASGNWWKRVRKRPGLIGWNTEPCSVLDPFLGSGTTAVVAKKLGRSYIGIELNPEYIVMAKDRLVKITGVQLELL